MNNLQEFLDKVNALESRQAANIRQRELEQRFISDITGKIDDNSKKIEYFSEAVQVLRAISDSGVQQSYEFITKRVNDVLSRIFVDRQIKLREYTRGGQYPQLEVELYANGDKRSFNCSGHGIAQTISFISLLTLIVITGSRRFIGMDEILSGTDEETRQVINEIMWEFSMIGFQFLVIERGFIPKGAKVYHLLRKPGDFTVILKEYIEPKGVYLAYSEDDAAIEEVMTPLA